jgi:hypothetical protein
MNLIEIYVPIYQNTFDKIMGNGNTKDALLADNYSKDLVSYIYDSDNCGNFDKYKNVIELSLGVELFTKPEDETNKEALEREYKSIKLSIFIEDLVEEDFTQIMNEIINKHPWECPILKVVFDSKIYFPEKQ